jgi:hypothetical protein
MKQLVISGVTAGLLVVAVGCGSAPTPEDTEVETSAVSGGQVETGYPAVGCLTSSSGSRCTGTLIAPNMVLSAKHCGPMITFNLGNTCGGGTPAQTRNIDRTISYHPEEGTGPSGSIYSYDLSVHHLQTPIYNVRPLQINTVGYPANGASCVAVGFGLDGVGGSGTKRSGTISVKSSGEVGVTVAGIGWVGMHSAIKINAGSGLPQSGDSGSPLLCNGTGVIQGVLSGTFTYPFTGTYYTGILASPSTSSGAMWPSAWVTNAVSSYNNEPIVSATSWSLNRFDLFVRGTAGAIYTKHYDGAAPPAADHSHWYPSMFGWTLLGGFTTGTPEAVSWGPNRIDVFFRGGDLNPKTDAASSMSLNHLYWNGSAWTWDSAASAGLASHPVAVSWGPNRLDVFALASNGYIGHWYGTNLITASELIPTDGGPSTFLPAMKAISTSSGNLDLYAIGTDNMAYHNHYDSFGEWTGWDNLGGPVVGTPTVATWGGGRQDIFFKSTNNTLYQKVYFGGTSWAPSQSQFWDLGGPIDGAPAAASMQPNWLTLISGNNGNPGGDTEGSAYKAWFNGSQWAPTNTTWLNLGGIHAGAPVLLAAPGAGINMFSAGGTFTLTISNYSPTGPASSYGWSGAGSLGGNVSW